MIHTATIDFPLDRMETAQVEKRSAADDARQVCLRAAETGQRAAVLVAADMVRLLATEALERAPAGPELGDWHDLLLDVATEIEDDDPVRAAELESLAQRVYRAIKRAESNPADQIADRPAARRVLEALWQLGDERPFAEVRSRSGHKPAHFSNILALLRDYGFVVSGTSKTDGRERVLSLTERGRSALMAARENGMLRPDMVCPDMLAASVPAPPLLKIVEERPRDDGGYQPPAPVVPKEHLVMATRESFVCGLVCGWNLNERSRGERR